MFKPFFRLIGLLNPFRTIRRAWFVFRNWRRKRVKHLDYITIALPASLDSLEKPRNWLIKRFQGDSTPSLTALERLFRQIADDPRPKGVILDLRQLALPLADLQTLRNSITRLRASGKRVICYAPFYSIPSYYLASAADEIILQRSGVVAITGLQQQATFLKDALSSIGVSFEVVAISPYKGAGDALSRSDISTEGREQLEWLLDSRYNMLINDIAQGRNLTTDQLQALIDSAPHVDSEALASDLVDAVLNEEDIPDHLNSEHIISQKRAEKVLLKQWRKRANKYIAVLPITGPIVDGESRKPPVDLPIPLVGGERTGDRTIIQQARQLMKNPNAAAVILYIDSPGGSAIASEAMTSTLIELAKTRPVIAYMNNVAASGGYYVATAARHIIAQPGTITGSIGVLSTKPVTAGMFKKLNINRLTFTRGKNAAMFGVTEPFTDEQRDKSRQIITHFYDIFVERVATARNMTAEQVDAVGGGRVWTGIQAHQHGLVDELGDLRTAYDKALALTNLPEHTPLALMTGEKGDPLPPLKAEAAALLPFSQMRYLWDGVADISHTPQMLLPFIID